MSFYTLNHVRRAQRNLRNSIRETDVQTEINLSARVHEGKPVVHVRVTEQQLSTLVDVHMKLSLFSSVFVTEESLWCKTFGGRTIRFGI